MAKISLSRILETSRLLSTEAGQQLTELIQYVSDVSEQLLRAMRNGLTFADNFACEVKTVKLEHNLAQTISTTKTPWGVLPARVLAGDSANAGLRGFDWWLDEKSQLVVKGQIAGSPAAGLTHEVNLIILY